MELLRQLELGDGVTDAARAHGPGEHVGTDNRVKSADEHPRRRGRTWVRPLVVGVAAVLGLAGLSIAAMPWAGFHTVMLATGSMSPTYPAGSMLITRDVPAADLHVGDVVMVDRGDNLPVTHRIIGIEGSGSGSPVRELTLQGDANEEADAAPYSVSEAGLVLAGSPWGGQVISAMRSPLALGILTMLVTSLVLWAWWPSASARDSRDDGNDGHDNDDGDNHERDNDGGDEQGDDERNRALADAPRELTTRELTSRN